MVRWNKNTTNQTIAGQKARLRRAQAGWAYLDSSIVVKLVGPVRRRSDRDKPKICIVLVRCHRMFAAADIPFVLALAHSHAMEAPARGIVELLYFGVFPIATLYV